MKTNYLNSLTWLRALAAFFVVVSHSMRTADVKYAPHDEPSYFLPVALLDLGTFGVYLFFALSGCTLYLSNEKKLSSASSFYNFVIKRFFRIWPAFAISLILYLFFIEFFLKFYIGDKTFFWLASFLREYTFSDVLTYLSLTFNITGPRGLFQGPYWSLPVEFQYYLLLPFCVFLMRSKWSSLIVPLLMGGVLYLIYSEGIIVFDRNEVFKMGYTFFGGVALAALYKYHPLKNTAVYSVLFFFIVVAFVSFVQIGWLNIPEYVPFLSDKLNVYGVCALLSVSIALNMESIKETNFATRFLSQYGEISYSIYLFHMIFVGGAALLVVNFEIYGDSPKLFFILFVSLFGSYFFSKLTYKYIEMPSVNIGRELCRPGKSTQRPAEAIVD